MFYTYALKSRKNGKHYYGCTKHLERRILEHNSLKDKKRFSVVNGPWDLIFSKSFPTRTLALQFEKLLKTGKGRDYLRQLRK